MTSKATSISLKVDVYVITSFTLEVLTVFYFDGISYLEIKKRIFFIASGSSKRRPRGSFRYISPFFAGEISPLLNHCVETFDMW